MPIGVLFRYVPIRNQFHGIIPSIDTVTTNASFEHISMPLTEVNDRAVTWRLAVRAIEAFMLLLLLMLMVLAMVTTTIMGDV